MRYAIVESGGKQYKAVEGELLDVDRLPEDQGEEILLERVLLMADGNHVQIGTPTLGGIEVKAKIVDHFAGPKLTHFRYSPKKRIRVRGGHRQQYTRLRVEFIGGKGEARPAPKAEMTQPPPAEASKKAPQKKAPTKKAAGSKPATKKLTK